MHYHEVYYGKNVKQDGEDVIEFVGFNQADVRGYVPPSLINMTAPNNLYKIYDSMMTILKA